MAMPLSSAKLNEQSSSTGQEAVLVVKSVQYGVRHNSAYSVETMPLALELHGEIQGRIGKAGAPKKSVVGRDCNAVVFSDDRAGARGSLGI